MRLGEADADRQTINRVHELFFPGAHTMMEPRQLVQDIVDAINERGWHSAMNQSARQEFLDAALRLGQAWPEDEEPVRSLARLFRENMRIAA